MILYNETKITGTHSVLKFLENCKKYGVKNKVQYIHTDNNIIHNSQIPVKNNHTRFDKSVLPSSIFTRRYWIGEKFILPVSTDLYILEILSTI